MSGVEYPVTRRDESVVDDFHGTLVRDPYRWLEDPDSKETEAWVRAQNVVTDSFLKNLDHRADFLQRLKEMHNYPKYSAPFKRGQKYFYWHNSGLQNQSVLYMQDSLDGESKVLLDPNALSTDGTASTGTYKFSDSGKFLAYAINRSGSDWAKIHVKTVDTGADHADILDWVKFSSIAWHPDESGFYYCRYLPPASFTGNDAKDKGTETDAARDQKVYYHALGTEQSKDKLVFEVPQHPDWMMGVQTTDDQRYLLITVSESCENVNRLYYVDLQQPSYDAVTGVFRPVKLIDNFEASYHYVANNGTQMFLSTNKDAPRNKLIRMDMAHPDQAAVEVIPQSADLLDTIICTADHFVAQYLQDAKAALKLFTMDGEHVHTFELPTAGSISSISGKREQTELFYSFVSFTHPGAIFHYDFVTKKQSVFRETKVAGFVPEDFETEQVFYYSDDGTRVPMFVLKKKSVDLDGNNAALLYGYGGFNISITPSFSVARVLWLQHYSGVLAIANLRGGEEYGEEWHKAGTLGRKQNVFDDFKAAARKLVAEGYTRHDKLSIMGGSNGGLLVTACVNQSPGLFAAGVAQVPVTDMLRFHQFTIGWAWCSDYGCADKPDDFKFLYKYSPLHTVQNSEPYPALLLTTGDHDDRVVPCHSYKYTAEVQHKLGSDPRQEKPLLVRIDVRAGHGAGKPLDKQLEEAADVYAFIAKYTGATWAD
eukprot:TRINITY_DN27079_c0_g1_i1.p1 TRINITY_DN27079_c0_g1~~TRINITY_DN27079_c0_g1_i1.p1  ORF type:complete len:746 (+),score=242.71 TRINITY_DN27079_c0_g1_i1:114-2240(+)